MTRIIKASSIKSVNELEVPFSLNAPDESSRVRVIDAAIYQAMLDAQELLARGESQIVLERDEAEIRAAFIEEESFAKTRQWSLDQAARELISISAERARTIRESKDDILLVALALTEKILGGPLDISLSVQSDIAHKVLNELVGSKKLRIHVPPERWANVDIGSYICLEIDDNVSLGFVRIEAGDISFLCSEDAIFLELQEYL